MGKFYKFLWSLLILSAGFGHAVAQTTGCPERPAPGTVVSNPLDLYSANGVLTAAFTLRREVSTYLEECYIYQNSTGPVEAPTLHLNPGDQLELSLTDRLTYVPPPPPTKQSAMTDMA